MHPITIALFFFWVAAVVGWILNIVAIAGSSFDVLSGMLILRVIGIFVAPLGAVLGYF
jgi:hypothetical protein